MQRPQWIPIALGLFGLFGCEAATPPPKSGAEAAPGAAAIKAPASQLGHYATPDGFVGLVLDRTGAAPKIKLDKTTDVIEVFLEEALDRGTMVGHWMNGPDGKHWLFLAESGSFGYIKPEARDYVTLRDVDRTALPLSRDGDAAPLAEATQKGVATPPPPKTAYDLAEEKLTAMSVVKKWPQFKPEDSGNFDKIEEVLRLLDAAALVRVSAAGSESAAYAPASPYIGDTNQSLGGRVAGYPSDDPWEKGATGLAKYGGVLWDAPRYATPSRLRLTTLKGWPEPLSKGTPGFIWMVDGTTVVFVGLDGGRYHLSLSGRPDQDGMPVDMGAGSPSAWPAPVQHVLFDVSSVRGLAKGHAIPEEAGKAMEALDDGYFSCVNKVWDEGRAESDKVEASQESADKKHGKLSSIPKRYEAKATKACEGEKKNLEAGLVAFIEQRQKGRLALYDKAKARAAALGLK